MTGAKSNYLEEDELKSDWQEHRYSEVDIFFPCE